MDNRVVFLLCILFAAYVLATPVSDELSSRSKRDVLDSMKSAWTDVVKTFTDAGDAVVNAFKPTEKSAIDKIADGVKNLGS